MEMKESGREREAADKERPERKKELREKILAKIADRGHLDDREILREIDRTILSSGEEAFSSLRQKQILRQELFDALCRLDILEKYLRDDSVTEIMVVGKDKVFIEQNGRITRTGDAFPDEENLRCLIDQMISPVNRIANESSPIVDSRLADGSRVHIILPPVSLVGPVITIRKFPTGGMTMEKLIACREFPQALAAILGCLVRARYNILISGATNSGKSSLLNALAEYIGRSERILTIEDSAELTFGHVENLVRLETRNANVEGRNAVTMDDLIRASLRMRPDRIVVGEVRGKEAVSMLSALSTGHSGSFSTIHANSCRDSLRRLETLVLMGMDLPLRAIQGLIASSIDILIHLERLKSGERRVTQIMELRGFDGTDYETACLFTLDKRDTLRAESGIGEEDKLYRYGEYDNYCRAMEIFKNQAAGKETRE